MMHSELCILNWLMLLFFKISAKFFGGLGRAIVAPARRHKKVLQLVPKAGCTLYVAANVYILVRSYYQRVKAFYVFSKAIFYGLFGQLFLVGAKQAVPDNKYAAVVTV